VTFAINNGAYTGTLNPDGSVVVPLNNANGAMRGVFAIEGGHTVIRDAVTEGWCHPGYAVTKQ
jgi:hypothetical protein